MSSRFSPNTEQKYLLNVAGVFAHSLALKQLQRLQDLLPCQDFSWPHDAITSPPCAAGFSWPETPVITFPLIYVLLVATSPLYHSYGFSHFPFIKLQQDGLQPNCLPEPGCLVKLSPARLCRDGSHCLVPTSGQRGRVPLGMLHPECPGRLTRLLRAGTGILGSWGRAGLREVAAR